MARQVAIAETFAEMRQFFDVENDSQPQSDIFQNSDL